MRKKRAVPKGRSIDRYDEEEKSLLLELLARHFTLPLALSKVIEVYPEAENKYSIHSLRMYFYSEVGRDAVDRVRAVLRRDAKRRPFGLSESRQNFLSEILEDLVSEFRGEDATPSMKLKTAEQIRRTIKDLREESELAKGRKKAPVEEMKEHLSTLQKENGSEGKSVN